MPWGGCQRRQWYEARDTQVYPEIYQTVVLRLPYITSHAVGSPNGPRSTCVRPYRALPFLLEIDGEGDGGEETL